jgi:hypothetical protein
MKKATLVLLVGTLAICGYFVLAWLNAGGLSHSSPGIGGICRSQKLPAGTIYTPGGELLPTGTSTTVPIGFECEFIMKDGSNVRTAHPDYVATVAAGLPVVLVMGWGSWFLVGQRRTRTKALD